MAERRLPALLISVAVTLAACGGVGTDPTEADAGSTDAAPASRSDDPLPDLEVDTFHGDVVALTDYVGTPLVVNFWASWCPPCIAEMPDLEAVNQLAAGRVTFVGVNTQDPEDSAERLAEETGVSYDLVRDPEGELFRELGVFGMPSTFYVDADGNVVGRHTGLLTRDALIGDLERHLGVELGTDA